MNTEEKKQELDKEKKQYARLKSRFPDRIMVIIKKHEESK